MIRYKRLYESEGSDWEGDRWGVYSKTIQYNGHEIEFVVKEAPHSRFSYAIFMEIDGQRDNAYGLASDEEFRSKREAMDYVDSHWKELVKDFRK